MLVNALLKTLRLLIPTLIILAVGAGLLNRLPALPLHYQPLFSQLPYLLAAISLILCTSFNQGRLFLSTLNLLCLFGLIQLQLQTSLDNPANYVLFTLLSLWFPLQQTLLSLYGERGISLHWALPRSLIIISGYLVLYALYQTGVLAAWITALPMSLMELAFGDLLLSQGATSVYLLALLCGMLILSLRSTLVDAALFGATLGSALTLLLFDSAFISALYASLTLLLFLYTVLFNSYSMAFIDELTGLPGRRALENHLASSGRQYSIAMVDVDHFKKFNDTYGHDVGDQVLRMVASQMKQAAKGASVFRYGGEEFTLVFKRKDEAMALPIAEQVREAIANYPMRIREDNRPEDTSQGRKHRTRSNGNSAVVQVCISIGLCEKTEAHDNSKAVLKQADESLYLAKQQGRNRTVAAHIAQTRKRKQATPISV